MNRPPPKSTLFPYTTLFRSETIWRLATVPSSSIRCLTLPASPDPDPLSWTPWMARECARSCRWHEGNEDRSRRSEEHTSELQSQFHLVCRLLLEKKKNIK